MAVLEPPLGRFEPDLLDDEEAPLREAEVSKSDLLRQRADRLGDPLRPDLQGLAISLMAGEAAS